MSPIGFGTTPFATGHWNRNSFGGVEQVFDFDNARDAIACIADGKVEGKVVVSLQPRK